MNGSGLWEDCAVHIHYCQLVTGSPAERLSTGLLLPLLLSLSSWSRILVFAEDAVGTDMYAEDPLSSMQTLQRMSRK